MNATAYVIIALVQAVFLINNHGVRIPENGKEQPADPAAITIRITNDDEVPDTLLLSKADLIGQERRWTAICGEVRNRTAIFVVNTNAPQYLQLNPIYRKYKNLNLLLEPGDDITFSTRSGTISATGRGAAKFELLMKMQQFTKSVPKPSNPKDYLTQSIADYCEWDAYLNVLLRGQDSLLSTFKPRLSAYTYSLLRALAIDQNIDDRSDKFHNLVFGLARTQNIAPATLCKIYDSLYSPAVTSYFNFCSQITYGNWKPILFKTFRTYGFDRSTPPLNSRYDAWVECYQRGIAHYKGIIREQFTIDFLYKHLLKEFGFTPTLEAFLKQFYSTSQSESCRQYMKNKVQHLRKILYSRKAPEFELEDSHGNQFTSKKLANKIAVIDFWFTGCSGCIQTAASLHKAEQYFKSDTNILFIKVSVDKQKATWQKSIKENRYTRQGGIHLYTQGQQEEHPIITQMDITSYPSLVFIDPFGRIIYPTDNTAGLKSDPDSLIRYIEMIRHRQNDGPYLFRQNNDSILCLTTAFNLPKTSKMPYGARLPVPTDIPGKYFEIECGEMAKPEPSYFPAAPKILALSDIEGNFAAFRRLLASNKVIDSNLNWTFRDGHLVICGDVFDRGEQVTECLWLIYSLEQQARQQGGYVHFILGNHDVMNLQGTNHYTDEKYKQLARSMEKDDKFLYNPNSILGQWLRSKNVIEQIGACLFVHGGIGLEFSALLAQPDLDLINRKFRTMIDTQWMQIPQSDTLAVNIFKAALGPLWYRQYYQESEHLQIGNDSTTAFYVMRPSQTQFDSLLQKWRASKIITGHTIVADTISTHYDGKLINLDTKHSAGKSEALLIQENIFYRTNDRGIRHKLFTTAQDN